MPTTSNLTITRSDVNCRRLPTAECRRIIHLVDYLYNVSNIEIKSVNSTLNSVHSLISHFMVEHARTNGSRVKRGLLNFVGELSHSLFGTARDKDITQLHAAIRHFTANQEAMSHVWHQSQNRLASLTKAVNHRLDHMRNLLYIQRQTARELYRQIKEETSTLSQANFIIALALVKVEDFMLLMDDMESFRHGVKLLSNEILSSKVTPPKHFKYVLEQIHGRIRVLTAGRLRVLRDKVTHYY